MFYDKLFVHKFIRYVCFFFHRFHICTILPRGQIFKVTTFLDFSVPPDFLVFLDPPFCKTPILCFSLRAILRTWTSLDVSVDVDGGRGGVRVPPYIEAKTPFLDKNDFPARGFFHVFRPKTPLRTKNDPFFDKTGLKN